MPPLLPSLYIVITIEISVTIITGEQYFVIFPFFFSGLAQVVGFLVILYFLLQRDLLSWILCDSYKITCFAPRKVKKNADKQQ